MFTDSISTACDISPSFRASVSTLFAVLLCSSTVHAQPAIVGFTPARAGGAALPSGSIVSTLGNGLISAIPTATFRGVDSLTELNVATDDVAILFSARAATVAISPLTPTEQSALLSFVQSGGSAVIFVDNDTFNGAASDPANESLLDPFGLDVVGTGAAWARNANVTNSLASPITSGPFGTITTYQIGWTGWFNQFGPNATSLATAQENGQSVLAVVPCGALGPQSGPVILFADSSMAVNGFINTTNLNLIRNAVAFAANGCQPTCDSIDFNNDTSLFDPQDIDAFLSVYGEGPCIPETATCNDIDFNNDSSVFDPCDIDSFLTQFGEGPCTLCGQ